MEKPKFKREWKGRYVRLLSEIQNRGGDVFDSGAIMVVEKNYGGLHLRGTIECKCCGGTIKRYLRRVDENSVELLPKGFVPEPQAHIARESEEVRRLKDLVQDMQRQMIELMPGASHG